MKAILQSIGGIVLLWSCIFGIAFLIGNYSYQLEILWAVFVFGIIGIPLVIGLIQKFKRSP